MDSYEDIVMRYLSHNYHFCCPQYSIKGDDGKEWRCPDFVVLDFDTPQVIVAEVTAVWDLGDFVAKAKEMYDEGRQRIRKELTARAKSNIPNVAQWPMKLQLFVLEDRKGDLENRIKQAGFPAEIITLERALKRNTEPAVSYGFEGGRLKIFIDNLLRLETAWTGPKPSFPETDIRLKKWAETLVAVEYAVESNYAEEFTASASLVADGFKQDAENVWRK